MDVRLPNGTIIRNVPEGTSKTDLMSKLVANGYDQSIFSAVGKEPEIAPDNYPKLAAVADVPLSFGRGAVTGVKMIADAFGADNPVSQTLSSVDTYLEDLMSAQSKKDAQEVSRIINEAKDKGAWDQVKAGLGALSVAPLDLVINAFGTIAPTALAGLLAFAAAPAVGVGTGTAVLATQLGVGATMGAGTIKDRIYTDVKQALTDQGVAPEKAEAAAQEAQAYEGKNLDQIMLGALFGAGASVSGVEKTLVKSLTSKILGNAAKEAVDVTEQAAAKGLTGRFVEGAVKEAVPEALQEGQEQVASNIAQQREGVDVPTFRGAVTSATLGGVTGGLLGGGLNVAVEPGPRTVDKSAEDDALLKALKVHAADVVAGKDVFLLEDKTGNRLLDFANSQRDAVPSLGPILDSNVPRDVKLNLIDTRLREAELGNVPEEPISLKGILALPAPEIKKSENLRQVFNNALDIAERSATPATEMSVNQGPEGYRIVGVGGKVMSDPINSEREANVVLEGLRRSYDMKQSEDYKIASADYRNRFDSEMADATLRAAKETMQPLMPVTMEEINNTNPELATKIQDSRRIDPDTKKTKQAIMSDVSFDEMRKRGATKDELFEIALMQQPYTGGTGRLRPGIEQDILGNRPSAPAQTARTPDELARLKLAEVTPVEDVGEMEFARAVKEKPSDAQQAFAEREGTAPAKPLRPEREVYSELPPTPRPSEEEVAQARQLIEDRVAKLEAIGKQGQAIGKGVRDALASSNFTPDQMLQAFKVADISGRLIGKTEADPHSFQFVERIATPSGGAARGARINPTEKLKGVIKIALDPKYHADLVKTTSAHESFHVLQDLFAAYDKAGAAVINNAFKGAKTLDDIDANLLRKLKSLRDPDTNKSVYNTIKDQVPQSVFDSYAQPVREREMQAYVFGYLDNAIVNGNQSVSGLGAAFVRFLNFLGRFKDRVGNYYKGLGYQTAEDVMSGTVRGKRQAGIGVAGELVKKALPGEDTEFSTARIRQGKENLSKYGIPKDAKGVLTRRLAEALEARQRAKYGTIARNDYSDEAVSRIAKWVAEEVKFAVDQQAEGADAGVGWYSEKYQRALDAFSKIFPELETDKVKRDLFTAVVALMSDGQKVYNNFSLAGRAYSEYRDTGRFPEVFKFGGERVVSMEGNLKKMNELLDQHGEEGTAKYLMEEMTVSELAKRAKEDGLKFSTSYKADVRLPMSALIFGPKLGAFYSNLMGSHGYLTMDRWWSRTFNRYRGQLVTRIIGTSDKPFNSKGEPIGLARFKVLLAQYDRRNSSWTTISDREAIARLQDFRDAYAVKKYKEGTEIEKAANTLYKAAFEGTEDQPFNASDRSFMIATTNRAKRMLKRQGIDLSLADIQAVLWYYEKRLYGELGARQTADISYEEAANRVVSDHLNEPGRWITHDAPETTVVGPDGSLIEVGDEEADVEPEEDVEFSQAENFSRIGMPHTKILDRDSVLEENVAKLEAGEITPDQWDALVRQRKPVELYDIENIPVPATPEQAVNALYENKQDKYGLAKQYYKEGDPVKLRLDIPAYAREDGKNAWVNAIHDGSSGTQTKKPTVYESVSAATDVTFSVTESAALATAKGAGKAPYATMRGGFKPITPKEAYAKAKQVHTDPAWVQVGMDPTRHSFFYTRGDMKPVVAAEEVLQIGPLVYAKNPTYAGRSEFEFSQAINATGQRAEAKVNSERYDQIWSKVREFFNPLALVNNLPQFLSFRNIATGSVTSSEKYARKMADLIAKGTLEDRNAVYTYMTTRGASASSIKSPEVRKAAIEAKNAVNKMAEVMIARKELTQESFEKYYDRYLPRIYLMFEETGRGMKSPLGGMSAREYLEMRDEKLTKEQREILGEIKDPSYLTYVALSRPARDMAMTDYLNSIMIFGADPKNQWVAPQSYVQYEGKSYTPYYLLTMVQDLLSAAKRAEDIAPDQSAAMKKEALKIQDVAVSAQIDLETKIDGITSQGYTQLPRRRQYGTLAGAVVQNGIYQDLVGTFIPVGKENRSLIDRLIGDEYSTLGKGVALWKLGKTTLNPPTQVVNFISNGIALNLFGGVPIHKYPELVKKTITEIKNNGKLWQEAQKYGISGGTMSQAELQKAFVRINRYQGRTEGEGTLMNMFTTSKILAATFVEGAGDVYQASETLFKMMKFIYGVETEKLSPSEAVNAANDILFDYSLVNNNIRWLRNAPLGLPFITYYYKVLPKIIETLYKHPERFIPYVALAYALPALTMATFDLDDDELEKLRLSAQDYIRDKGTLFFLPYRDGKGNIQFVDVGKYLPFSTLLSPFMTAYNSGDIVKAGRELLTPVTPGGPVITAIAALATGRDPFTDKEIMDPRDTTKNQAFSMFSYIFNQAMPPAIGFDLKNLENSAGAIPALYNSLFTDGTGVDKRGMPKPETLEAAARLLGLNITPLKADVQRIQNLNYMMSQINKTKAYQTEVSKDQSLTPQRRGEKIRELAEKMREQTKKMQEYANATAGVGQIVRKIKEAP